MNEKKLTPEIAAKIVSKMDWDGIAKAYQKYQFEWSRAQWKTFTEYVRLQAQKALLEEIKGSMKLTKPTHGPCCTCQVCGFDKDNCECYENSKRVLNKLDQLKADK